MTTRSRDAIVCQCGHKGAVVCSENDQPYSSLWERYSLEGFAGGELVITSYKDMPKDILASLGPVCPRCNQTNKVSYAQGS